MNDSRSDDMDDLTSRLAGYVDGELSAFDRRAVENWLEGQPGAAEGLREQESLARSNGEYWASVEPPEPSPAEWERVRAAIEARCIVVSVRGSNPRTRWVAPLLAVAASGILAALGIWWMSGADALPGADRPESGSIAVAPPPRPSDDPLAEFAVLPVANVDDVQVEAVWGLAPAWVYAADHPVPGEIPLAGPGDLTLLEVRPPAGRSGTAAVILAERP